MVRCDAMSALVEEGSATAAASSASAGVTDMPMLMVRCDAMSWTDEVVWRPRVLVTRRDLVTGAVTVTEEQTVQRARFTALHGNRRRAALCGAQVVREAAAGDAAAGRQAQAHRHRKGRGARRQAQVQAKGERQAEALLARTRDWSAHVFDCKRADSVHVFDPQARGLGTRVRPPSARTRWRARRRWWRSA